MRINWKITNLSIILNTRDLFINSAMDSDNENLSNEDIMESHKSKSTDMEEDLDIDVGTLLASNYNALDMKALK